MSDNIDLTETTSAANPTEASEKIDKTAQNLPSALKKALETAEMNSAELSRKSGVSLASLSRILSGQVSPSFANIYKIAKALHISLDSLTGQPIFTSLKGGKTKQKQSIESAITISTHQNETDILASFNVENTESRSCEEIARLLANTANGVWVESWTDRFIDTENLAKVRPITALPMPHNRVSVDLAFPHEMVEEGSIVSLLSVVSAAVTGTGAQITDIRIPTTLVRSYQQPAFGIRGLRDISGKFGRPLLSVTMRPMNGLSPRIYGKAVYETLKGGVDITCDPTMMHSLPTNRWRERFRFVAEAVVTAERETNEMKFHAVNISATGDEIYKRAEYAYEIGLKMVMVDSAAIGWATLPAIAKWCEEHDLILCAMGGRSLSSGIMSEQLIAKLLRFCGCDVVSIGSPLRSSPLRGGQSRGSTKNRRYIKGIIEALTANNPQPQDNCADILFEQSSCSFPASMPACGGGHNPWHFPRLLDALGNDHIIQCGGNVMGHPWGCEAGARANRVAIESLVQANAEGQNLTVNGRNILQKAATNSQELEIALEHWQEGSFLFGVIDNSNRGKLDADINQTPLCITPFTTISPSYNPPTDDNNPSKGN